MKPQKILNLNHRELLDYIKTLEPFPTELISKKPVLPDVQKYSNLVKRNPVVDKVINTTDPLHRYYKITDPDLLSGQNPMFKIKHSRFEYNLDLINEMHRCTNDIFYFANNYCHVVGSEGELVKFQLRPYQYDLLEHLETHRQSLVLGARRIGKTTIMAIKLAHTMIFGSKQCMVVGYDAANYEDVMGVVRTILEHLPSFMQPCPITHAAGEMEFDHGSSLVGKTANGMSFRGMGSQLIFLDEYGFYGKKSGLVFKAIYQLISNSKTAKLVIASTANGTDNHFYQLVKKCRSKGNDFALFEADFRVIEERLFNKNRTFDNGASWKRNEIRNTGANEFASEQENIFEFVAEKVFPAADIEYLESKRYDPMVIDNELVRIYSEYNEYYEHYLCIDTSTGSGGDAYCANVFCDYGTSFELVASFSEKTVNLKAMPSLMVKIAEMYKAWIVCEITNTRSISATLMDKIKAAGYPKLYTDSDDRLGIEMIKANKINAIKLAKQLFDDGLVHISDETFIAELRDYGKIGRDSYGGLSGHDDMISTLLIFLIAVKLDVSDFSSYVERYIEPVVNEPEFSISIDDRIKLEKLEFEKRKFESELLEKERERARKDKEDSLWASIVGGGRHAAAEVANAVKKPFSAVMETWDAVADEIHDRRNLTAAQRRDKTMAKLEREASLRMADPEYRQQIYRQQQHQSSYQQQQQARQPDRVRDDGIDPYRVQYNQPMELEYGNHLMGQQSMTIERVAPQQRQQQLKQNQFELYDDDDRGFSGRTANGFVDNSFDQGYGNNYENI